jgi:hypothetical protein
MRVIQSMKKSLTVAIVSWLSIALKSVVMYFILNNLIILCKIIKTQKLGFYFVFLCRLNPYYKNQKYSNDKVMLNINKIATLRNARGGNVPDLLKVATDIQKIWCRRNYHIHPRPDERHIRYQDARDLKSIVYTEYNIEGNLENHS